MYRTASPRRTHTLSPAWVPMFPNPRWPFSVTKNTLVPQKRVAKSHTGWKRSPDPSSRSLVLPLYTLSRYSMRSGKTSSQQVGNGGPVIVVPSKAGGRLDKKTGSYPCASKDRPHPPLSYRQNRPNGGSSLQMRSRAGRCATTYACLPRIVMPTSGTLRDSSR